MHHILINFSDKYVKAEIIDKEMVDWFIYAVEKRVLTVITVSILYLIAALITNTWTAISYLLSFYFLRCRTSGYHANSYLGCLCCSILLEIFFLLILLPVLNKHIVYILNIVSLIIIFGLAPFNHPNMSMTAEEIRACRISARLRICGLVALGVTSYFSISKNLGEGITLGSTMTALLLVYVKIQEWRVYQNEQNRIKEKNGKCIN